jgi:hypothetical protein
MSLPPINRSTALYLPIRISESCDLSGRQMSFRESAETAVLGGARLSRCQEDRELCLGKT